MALFLILIVVFGLVFAGPIGAMLGVVISLLIMILEAR